MGDDKIEANAAIDELRDEETLLKFDDGPAPTLEEWNRLWDAGYLQYSNKAVKVFVRKGAW